MKLLSDMSSGSSDSTQCATCVSNTGRHCTPSLFIAATSDRQSCSTFSTRPLSMTSRSPWSNACGSFTKSIRNTSFVISAACTRHSSPPASPRVTHSQSTKTTACSSIRLHAARSAVSESMTKGPAEVWAGAAAEGRAPDEDEGKGDCAVACEDGFSCWAETAAGFWGEADEATGADGAAAAGNEAAADADWANTITSTAAGLGGEVGVRGKLEGRNDTRAPFS